MNRNLSILLLIIFCLAIQINAQDNSTNTTNATVFGDASSGDLNLTCASESDGSMVGDDGPCIEISNEYCCAHIISGGEDFHQCTKENSFKDLREAAKKANVTDFEIYCDISNFHEVNVMTFLLGVFTLAYSL